MASTKSSQTPTVVPGAMTVMTGQPLLGRRGAGVSSASLANLPRTQRARVSRAVGRKRKAVSPQSPPSPNQESAVNSRTGKVALGPWLGPYETHTESLLGSPLFTDFQGNVYGALDKSAVDRAALPNMPGKDSAATQQLSALLANGVFERQRSRGTKREQAPSVYPTRGKQMSGRCGNILGRTIQQPRRS